MTPRLAVVERAWYEHELGWTSERYERELAALERQFSPRLDVITKSDGTLLTVTDLFAGAGGSSTGMSQVPGVEVRMAANHWPWAIAVHNTNHPYTDHAEADLHQENPAFFPRTDILWASPECTKWSQAGGSQAKPAIEEGLFEDPLSSDAATRSRLLMFDVLKFIEYHKYRAVIVENVVDIATNAKYRLAWAEWRRQLHELGYLFKVVSLNSMHAQAHGDPAPQSRDRIYVIAWREGERAPDLERVLRPKAYCPKCDQMIRAVQSWKNGRKVGRYRQTYLYVHSQCGTVVEPAWLSAAHAIDWSIPGTVIGDRLAEKTRRRIAAGIARYWGPLTIEAAGNTYDAADPKHVSYGDPNAYYRAWPLDEPLRALHTTASKAWVQPPLLDKLYGTGVAHPVTDPAATFTAGGNHHALVMANTWRNRAHPVSEAMPTMTTATGGGSMLAQHPDAPNGDTCWASGRTRTAACGEPTRADVFNGVYCRCERGEPGVDMRAQHPEALLDAFYGTSRSARPASDPLGALTTHDRYALVHRNNGGGAEMSTPIFEELRTLTTAGHQSLLQHPHPEVTPADLERAEKIVPEVLYRMLRPHEVARGMAFPDTYEWDVPYTAGKRKGKAPSAQDKVKAAGNAVTPPAARDLVWCVAESITGEDLAA